jgi:hypothetical protein
MKNFWTKYWAWSDKINAPFQKHKDRLILYVVLSQTVIVTVGLLNLFKTNNDQLILHCRAIDFTDTICMQAEIITTKE